MKQDDAHRRLTEILNLLTQAGVPDDSAARGLSEPMEFVG